jgi:Uncharacterised nucleotidyltransferase
MLFSALIKLDRPEVELLLYCARTQPNPETIAKIQDIVKSNEIDWDYLMQMAHKHRIWPLVYLNLNSLCKQALPKNMHHQLQGQFFANTQNNFCLTKELLHLLPLFSQQQLRVLPYKGTVLAATVYGKVAFRQVWDIDLLVPPSDFTASCNLLVSQGYQVRETFDREQAFFHPEKNVEVDLHWGITPIYFSIPINFEQFWQRKQTVTLVNTPLDTFSYEDLLLILCVQVAKDCWERRQHLEHLAKVCDIAELITHIPQLDWQYILDQAQAWDAITILYFGLALAQGLLATPLPPSICAELQSRPRVETLTRQVSRQLFGNIDTTLVPAHNSLLDVELRLRQLQFYFKLRDSTSPKLQYLTDILKTIGNTMLQGLNSN